MPTERLHYGTTAKVFHWLIVALLAIQLPLGWLMPDIHRGMTPGIAMSMHVSIGMTILVLIVLRLL
jgi:cytochrome b561